MENISNEELLKMLINATEALLLTTKDLIPQMKDLPDKSSVGISKEFLMRKIFEKFDEVDFLIKKFN